MAIINIRCCWFLRVFLKYGLCLAESGFISGAFIIAFARVRIRLNFPEFMGLVQKRIRRLWL